ncbi:MAG: C25 family cysteine peptidase [Euryarchaeota archaeon]|nr:C25 family cysteine peptidase [Euryarchaeota archaeon]
MSENNKIIKVFGAVVVLLLVTSISVVAIGTNPYKASKIGNDSVFVVNNADASAIDITVNTPALEFGSAYMNGKNFATLELPNEGFTIAQGEAQLPTLKRMVEIPQGAKADIVVKSISWEATSLKDLGLPARIAPVQPPLVKIPGATQSFVINEKYYAKNVFTPTNIAKVVSTGEIRGRRFALIEVSPVQYNPVSGKLKIMTTCELKVNLYGSDMVRTSEKIERYSTPSFEDMFKTTFVNYGFYEKNIANNPKDQEGYLIIVYTDFSDEIQPLADWKESKGFDTTVTTTSEIPGGSTKENIKAYIVDAYNNWPIPPTYVLLVGDVAQIPSWTGSATGTCTDLYYVTIDSGNYFADIIVSRFPAALPEHVTAMVDKTIYYEQGSFPSSEWIKKAAFMASEDNYDISEGTHNYVIDTYLNPNGYTCDKLYSHTYDATTQQVTDALNNGRSLAIYSGHGGTDYWADGPYFDQSNVNALTNDGMYPFVCSHACVTGTFSDAECFGETWLRAPNKAGLAFWGASQSTYWDEDDILERSMFKAWWEDNLENIGGMTNMALYYLYQYYSGGGSTQYYFEAYNVLGDSSIKIWRNNPSNPPATPETPTGPTHGIINVEYAFSSSTIEPDGDQIYYMFSWGDGTYSEWLGPYASGTTVTDAHSWSTVGTYDVKVSAKDTYGAQSDWSMPLTISIVDNNPPNTPTINGPTSGKPGVTYLYTFFTNDDDGDDVYYFVDWGDETNSNWLGPFGSGVQASASHSWNTEGTYTVKVKAKDVQGDESNWGTLDVIMPLDLQDNQLLLKILKQL